MIYPLAGRTPVMASPKKLLPSKPRNVLVRAMMKRHGRTTSVMKDRRASRGGTRNKARDYLADNY